MPPPHRLRDDTDHGRAPVGVHALEACPVPGPGLDEPVPAIGDADLLGAGRGRDLAAHRQRLALPDRAPSEPLTGMHGSARPGQNRPDRDDDQGSTRDERIGAVERDGEQGSGDREDQGPDVRPRGTPAGLQRMAVGAGRHVRPVRGPRAQGPSRDRVDHAVRGDRGHPELGLEGQPVGEDGVSHRLDVLRDHVVATTDDREARAASSRPSAPRGDAPTMTCVCVRVAAVRSTQ